MAGGRIFAGALIGVWLAATPGPARAAEPLGKDAGSDPGTIPAFVDKLVVTSNLELVSDGTIRCWWAVGSGPRVPEPSLRELFAASGLVFAGSVRSAEIVAVHDGLAEVRTTLRIDRRFKGEGWDRWVTLRSELPLAALELGGADVLPELNPEATVVAFLDRAEVETGFAGRPVYQAARRSGGLRVAGVAATAAYGDRLEALARLYPSAGSAGELDPAGLMDWLVATAENPFTRKEKAIREIDRAFSKFEAFAREEPDEIDPEVVLGAMLNGRHQQRLTAALLATERLEEEDVELGWLVYGFDPEAARSWLIRALRQAPIPNGGQTWWLLDSLTAFLSEAPDPFLESAAQRFDAIDASWPGDRSPATEEVRIGKRLELSRELFAELATLLESAG